MNKTARTNVVPHAAPPQSLAVVGGNPYMAMLDRALAAGQTMESLGSLLDLQIKWEANEARKAFVAAMANFKREPMTITKNKQVSFPTQGGGETSYTHAELADVTNVVVPALARNGISHRWDIKQEGGSITVTCTLTHELGHSESVQMTAAPDASGKKNAIQQVASTNTYLQRYTLLAITGMATQGQDLDGRTVGEDGRILEGHFEAIDPDQDWLDAIGECDNLADLASRKKELLDKVGLGDPDKVPEKLRAACQRRKEAILRAEAGIEQA